MGPKRFLSLWYIRREPCTDFESRLALSPNGPKRASLELRHLGVPLGVSKTISEPMVRLAQTVHLSTPTITPSPNGPNEIPHDPCHQGVPSAASKMISKPMLRSTQTVHRSCVKISTISKQTETSIHLSLVS